MTEQTGILPVFYPVFQRKIFGIFKIDSQKNTESEDQYIIDTGKEGAIMVYVNMETITDASSGIIAHQVNCQGVIGAGVSGAIIEKYPEVKRGYEIWCSGLRTPEQRFGTVQLIRVSHSVSVANIFSQRNYGNAKKTGKKYTDENELVRSIVQICKEYPYRNVYIPEFIGCGSAGGDWCYVFSQLNAARLENLHVVHREENNDNAN